MHKNDQPKVLPRGVSIVINCVCTYMWLLFEFLYAACHMSLATTLDLILYMISRDVPAGGLDGVSLRGPLDTVITVEDLRGVLNSSVPELGTNPLRVKFRIVVLATKPFQLLLNKETWSLSNPKISQFTTVMKYFHKSSWSMHTLSALLIAQPPKNSILKLIKRVVKTDSGITLDDEDKYYMVNILSAVVKGTAPRSDTSQAQFKKILMFSALGYDFTVEGFITNFEREVRTKGGMSSESYIKFTFVCICIFSHYFPLRLSSIANLTISNYNSMTLHTSDAVVCMEYIDHKNSKHRIRAFPLIVKHLLDVYVDHVRISNGSDILFTNASGIPLRDQYCSLSAFILRNWRKNGVDIDYTGPNLRRKLYETILRTTTSTNLVDKGVEHTGAIGRRHYLLENQASAILVLKLWIKGMQDFYVTSNEEIAKEWNSLTKKVLLG